MFSRNVSCAAIATSDVQDVREVLDFYNQFDDPIEAFRENQRKLQVNKMKKVGRKYLIDWICRNSKN